MDGKIKAHSPVSVKRRLSPTKEKKNYVSRGLSDNRATIQAEERPRTLLHNPAGSVEPRRAVKSRSDRTARSHPPDLDPVSLELKDTDIQPIEQILFK